MGMLIGDKESYSDECFGETKKQEAIRLAYGDYWETVKYFVDEKGWLDLRPLKETLEVMDIELDYNFSFCRPKSLSGIETNNSWLSIESEEDLPKVSYGQDLYCFIKSSDHIEIGMGLFSGLSNSFLTFYRNEYSNVTHYQPIQKPNPPIF